MANTRLQLLETLLKQVTSQLLNEIKETNVDIAEVNKQLIQTVAIIRQLL